MDLLAMQKHNINLEHIAKGLSIDIVPIIADTLFKVADAAENNEAEYQLVEGCYYQYRLPKEYSLAKNEVVEVSNFNTSEGRISPNFYVGTLSIPILKNKNIIGILKLEVQSIKTSYRKDYRFMLESITKHASDLILQTNSPVNQTFEVDNDSNPKTLYQQFCFVKSIIETEDFEVAIQQITKAPVTTWTNKIENKDIRSLKKLSSRDVRNLIHSQNRTKLPQNHSLQSKGFDSIATKIPTSIKEETTDTPENRFIKYVLETFLFFCEEIQLKSKNGSRLYQEAKTIANKLENHLQHSLFREVSRLTSIKLNSPILQKKTGYREVLKAKLMFDLSAKLIWEGGEDVYAGGSKHVAKLYEYWLFFKLLKAIKVTFKIESEEYKKLIAKTGDKLGLQLKEGKQIALKGTYVSNERELSIQFSYNKTFGINNELSKEGSWTLQMDPDYTLSIWPKEIEKKDAEKTEQIVHIHFDAKYKVKNKEDNSKFKREDILKMHAYKDAIRRTSGAYILYPGVDVKPTNFKGFHEVLPGLGAFAIRPSEENSGIEELIKFITEVKEHFLNRASQRENLATKTYDITGGGKSFPLNESIPEYLDNKKLIPDETFVLVGYVKNSKRKARLDWHLKEGKYNFRMNDDFGGLKFTEKEAKAKFLLLRDSANGKADKLYKLKQGIQVFTGKKLEEMKHPEAKKDAYLVVEFEKEILKEFQGVNFNYDLTPEYIELSHKHKNPLILAGIPFTTTLSQLFNKQ